MLAIDRKGIPHRSPRQVIASHPLGKAGAEIVQGSARVVDGDTLVIGERRVRLFGVDAPESRQTCTVNASEVALGKISAHALAQLVNGRFVVCFVVDYDRYKRAVTVCEADDTELNFTMVREGWARAYTQYSRGYISAENHARAGRMGMWKCDQMIEPWAWRHAQASSSGS